MQYRLRTLLIVLALGPPVLAGAWWVCSLPVVHPLAFRLPAALFAIAILAVVYAPRIRALTSGSKS